jgi:spermidine synthase
MIPWAELAVAPVPGGEGQLRLMRRGAEFAIFAGAVELMGTRQSGSEEALAALTCARLADRQRARMLIGGLGMGFTLRAALAALGPDAAVTVAELVPDVIAWAQGPLSHVHGRSLEDPRVTLLAEDVAVAIRRRRADWDAILLDVDNGPEGLMRKANDDLYDAYGLGEAKAALRPGGTLAVWSSAAHPAFAKRLRAVGFAVEERTVRARGARGGARHVIWLARAPMGRA